MDRYRLCIQGKNPDYFLKKVIDKKINIYEVNKEYNKLCLVVDKDGYNKIKKIKTSYKIEIIGVSGLLKIKEIINKYFFFIIFFCMGVLLNIFFSSLIFNVEVVHSNNYIKELVYADLKQFGISKFKFKVSYDEKEQIINKILKKEKNDIEWLEIEEVGTKYIVKVEQRKLNDEEQICSNRNIVAKKNATILEIHADSGEIVKKKLDYVLKDEVIISGIIHNKEDIVSNRCAVGQVFGEVWYQVDVELPTKYHESIATGKNNFRFTFDLLNKKIILFNAYNSFREEKLFSISNSFLPISFNFSKLYETNEKHYSYTLDNCEEKAIAIALEKLKVKLGEEDRILTKKVLKKSLKNSKIIVEVFFKVKEDITSYKDIVIEETKEDGG